MKMSSTWFYRILRHSIIDLYRRRDVRDRALERLQAELPEQPDAAVGRVLCQCVKRLLPGLPQQYRDVLQRIDLDGASPKEAAAALGLTANNLTVRLHRARQRLRAESKQSCKVCSKHGCLDCTCDPADDGSARRPLPPPRSEPDYFFSGFFFASSAIFLRYFARLLVEVLEAGLAAELDGLAFVDELVRLHLAALEFLVGHDALGERVRLGLFVGGLVVGAGAQDSGSQAGEQNRSEDVFRELHTCLLSLMVVVSPSP